MGDHIWSNRFVQRGTVPAWHHKGLLIGNQELTAVQALHMVGDYEVGLHPLTVTVPTPNGDEVLRTSYSIIVREPITDDPHRVVFGSPVHESYELIGPLQAAELWDRAVVNEDGKTAPIETFGILKQGKELFISTRIVKISVAGDEIVLYMVFDNPMYSNDAAVGVITAVRPVCANTLSLGIQKATSKIVVAHTPGATERLEEWLKDMYQAATGVVQIAQSDFEAMANRHLKEVEGKKLIEEVYTDPVEPKEEWHNQFGLSYEQHLERFEEKLQRVQQIRSTVLDLYGGAGVALDTKATAGTAFGLYNAVAEYEDNRLGTAENRAIGVTIGERASTVKKAYRVLVDYSRNS